MKRIRRKKSKHTSYKKLGFEKSVVGMLKESLNSMSSTFKKRKRQLGL